MRALLMHPDRDFDPELPLPWNEAALAQDLGLGSILDAMGRGDGFLRDVARRAVLTATRNDVATVLHRQAIATDALRNPDAVRALYELAVEGLESRKRGFFAFLGQYPGTTLHGSIELMQGYLDVLLKMRHLAEARAPQFGSAGFQALFAMLRCELDDEYVSTVRRHLRTLKFGDGVLMSAQLGEGNAGTGYVLRQPHDDRRRWWERLLPSRQPGFTFALAERDEAGARALTLLRDRGIASVARAMGQSADHVLGFFGMLRSELAFYVGCLNLHDAVAARGLPTCMPRPAPADGPRHRFEGLYDVSLALNTDRPIVGNSANADGKRLAIVTGANQGGKSTFLRSVGQAQLMMQSGMFVGAESFAADPCRVLVTHYKREEDATMKSGKLDEELARMSELTEHLVPGAMLLFNESFAATNEREGSEIASQIVRALIEKQLKVFYVTHLYAFARGLYDRRMPEAIFFRAERAPDATRTFKIVEGEPLETSFGADLYREIFRPQGPADGEARAALPPRVHVGAEEDPARAAADGGDPSQP